MCVTNDIGIRFDPSSSLSVVGYSDSDWAGTIASCEYTEGYVFKMEAGDISWRFKKQTIVALSSCEAEYIFLCTAAKNDIWPPKVLRSLSGHANPTSVSIPVNSHGLISSAENMSVNARNKREDICYRFVRQAVSFK